MRTTVTVVRIAGTGHRDDLGIEQRTTTSTDVPGCSVQPWATYEEASGGPTDRGWGKWQVFMPAEPRVTGSDRLVVASMPDVPDLSVEGEAFLWLDGRGVPSHQRFLATRWTG